MFIDSSARGVYVIAPTPFLVDGSVDVPSIDRMVDFYLECGTNGITVMGQMGEAPKLDEQEAVEIASRVIRRAGVPVIVGVSAPGFAAMRSLSRTVMGNPLRARKIASARHPLRGPVANW